jgi:hypothetical protein
MTEKRTHSRAREQRSSRAPVQNMDVDMDVDEDGEEEEWHLDVEEDNIQGEIDMDGIENAMDVKEIVKEW